MIPVGTEVSVVQGSEDDDDDGGDVEKGRETSGADEAEVELYPSPFRRGFSGISMRFERRLFES